MLSDREIDQAAAQLQEIRLQSDRYMKNQTEVLESYHQLIEDYQRLKSDYEEERSNRERYKQLARGSERNPFVLVLVDGDGYVFDDGLLSKKGEGGSLAAQMLHDTVQRTISSRGLDLDDCRIMVRIYTNLVGLSKAAASAHICGFDKRALAPFVANFNRSNGLFDMVDAGELKENADFKIRAIFRQFVENPQCKHIFFAAGLIDPTISKSAEWAVWRTRSVTGYLTNVPSAFVQPALSSG